METTNSNKATGATIEAQFKEQGHKGKAATAKTLAQFVSQNNFGMGGNTTATTKLVADYYKSVVGEINANNSTSFGCQVVNASEAGIRVSSVVITVPSMSGDVLAYPILIEDSIPRGSVKPRTANVADGHNGHQRVDYTPVVTISDYASRGYTDRVRELLAVRLGKPGKPANVFMVGWTHVSRTDVVTEETVAAAPLQTALSGLIPFTPNYEALSGDLLETSENPLCIQVRGRDNRMTDRGGNPVRADNVIEMVRNQDFRSSASWDINDVDASSQCQVSTALSFKYRSRNTDIFGGGTQPEQTQFFPCLNITNIDVQAPNSLGLSVLGIVSMLRLNENGERRWLHSLLGTEGTIHSPVPMSSFILNPAETGGKMKPVAPAKGKVDWDYLVSIMPHLMTDKTPVLYSMDLHEGGLDANVADTLREMVMNPNGAVATRATAELNALTGGLYSAEIERAGGLAAMQGVGQIEPTLVPLGTYVDEQGEKQDLRHIDLLAILNASAGKESPDSIVVQWNTLHDPQAGDGDYRFAKLVEFISQYFTIDVTGKAYRLVFNQRWLISTALAVTGAIKVIANQDYFQRQAGVPSTNVYANMGVDNNVSVFNTGASRGQTSFTSGTASGFHSS